MELLKRLILSSDFLLSKFRLRVDIGHSINPTSIEEVNFDNISGDSAFSNNMYALKGQWHNVGSYVFGEYVAC